MIEKDTDEHNTWYCVCDFCSNETSIRAVRFIGVVEILKDKGWKVLRVNDEWMHKCPSCQTHIVQE